jgi:hypothetical protein
MGFLLSFLSRRWLRAAMVEQWRRSLSPGDRARFDYWGATGNAAHHRFAWADEIPPKGLQHGRGKSK